MMTFFISHDKYMIAAFKAAYHRSDEPLEVNLCAKSEARCALKYAKLKRIARDICDFKAEFDEHELRYLEAFRENMNFH